MLTNGTPGEAYNVANMNTEISIKDLALKFIENYQDCKTNLIFDISEAEAAKLGYNKVQRNVLNSEKLLSIGWEPKFSLDETIIKLVEYMSQNK